MLNKIKIATWNTNGLSPNKGEVEVLLKMHDLDILFIAETHFTKNSQIYIKNYNIYTTNHPDGTAHGGTAVLIKSTIDHYELPSYTTEHIQATSIQIQDRNAHWGSRLSTTRGRQLKKCVDRNHLTTIATSEPTHWPTDPNKLPDVLDFFITKGLSRLYYKVDGCLDGSSNHIPVILTVSTNVLSQQKNHRLYNRHTNWELFRTLVEDSLQLRVSLKTEDEIDNAVLEFTRTVQEACWTSSKEVTQNNTRQNSVPQEIRQMILEKRRLRRVWHTSRHADDKRALNAYTKSLKQAMQETQNATVEANLLSLSATANTNYSLWKACKNMDQPTNPKPPLHLNGNTWARSRQEKANAFAEHLSKVFVPNKESLGSNEDEIDEILQQDFQLDVPLKVATPGEIRGIINQLDNKKAPGFDLIDKKVLSELPRKAIMYLTTVFNCIIRLGYFPALWKVSQVIMVHKAGKPPHEVSSYRPLSLLPTISKILEKVLLRRLSHAMRENSVTPDHQFGFRPEHATTEQVHRVCKFISDGLERKQYCSTAFLDVQQAFDRVWHKGLLCKIKLLLPHTFYRILESYLTNRIFQVKEVDSTSGFYDILAGVPQGSVLGPVLYTIFTADLPQTPGVTIATYADDTAILASSTHAIEASAALQRCLNDINQWFDKWRIKANVNKSVQVTFTLRRETCPPVYLGGRQLPHSESVKYLGMHLDRRLTWQKHIESKRCEINLKYKGLYWLLGRNSKLSLDNKLLVYKCAIKPVWTYGIQLWGATCDSNKNKIQRTQNYILKQICNAPWFIRNSEVHKYTNMPTVKEEIGACAGKYKTRLEKHPNQLAVQLTLPDCVHRLKRHRVMELGSI
ncbi:hypothetical protein PYW07_010884 [Mythimna separata]|uniref:Reverse transcriptase domain-containing protein n=1 Tax=Mythimna separata TaxID=271217 RepID=A0AAD7Y8A5_MYTSE|nr:hypothetical protein PYW07_010884 [Mythimna separata]